MFTIRQTATGWDLLDDTGAVLATVAHYGELVAILGDLAGSQVAAMDSGGDAGLLPEPWIAPTAFLSQETGDGRDFTETDWSWRDPNVSLLPLMLHTETDVGHFGAELAGFVTTVDETGGVGTMRGRFYDTEQGRAARDLLLDGRRFGVSVDPGGGTAMEFRCVELDDSGACVDEVMAFLTYEVIGLTMTPFPGFAEASIQLDATPAAGEPGPVEAVTVTTGTAAAVVTSTAIASEGPCHECEEESRLASVVAAGAPVAPLAEWFANPQLSRLSAPRYEPSGQVYGHLAPWGQCHIGSAPGECLTTPMSATGYAYFQTGYVVCADGTEVAVGQLTVGEGHADRVLSYRGATEHYDNVAHAFADVAIGEDAYGIWFAGALRPGVSDEMLRVVRASPPSGDWRPVGRGLELVAACSVSTQGFPIARVASGGRVTALVAAGAAVMAALVDVPEEDRLSRVERDLAVLTAMASAPARDRLRTISADRARERLRATRR